MTIIITAAVISILTIVRTLLAVITTCTQTINITRLPIRVTYGTAHRQHHEYM